MVFAFDDYRLNVERRELRRDAETIELEPRAFDLLVYLVRQRDRVVGKDDLIAAVWGGRIVSDSALTTRINAVRRAIGDSGAAQRLVRTFPRKGVRFIGEVAESASEATPSFEPAAGAAARHPMPVAPNGPSIAVLPFANLSGDPEQEYFADGMVEEIITALSRICWLFVIARNSSFTYKGQSVDVKQIARELGVRYLLEGSVRKAAGRVRIAAQLIEAETGVHLWADRFDGSLEDVFELQDKVAASVAGVIEPALEAAEAARTAGRPTSDLTAYDAYLRARAMMVASAKQVPQALALLEEAIARDPGYGPALAFAAVICYRLCHDGSSADPQTDSRKCVGYARRALQAAPEDPAVLANAAAALAYFGEDIDAMIALVNRALVLNPSYARGWYVSAMLRQFAGEPEATTELIETALRLCPRGRIGAVYLIVGCGLMMRRRFEEAIPQLLLGIQEDPNLPSHYRLLAGCYAHLGRLDEARATIARLRAAAPSGLSPLHARFRNQFRKAEHRELFLSGLRLAMDDPGWPDAGRVLEVRI